MNKKNILTTIALFALLLFSNSINKANAQVFIMTEDEYHYSNRTPSAGIGILPDLPDDNDLTSDAYAPLGNGILVLGWLSGAYLLGRRRKHDND